MEQHPGIGALRRTGRPAVGASPPNCTENSRGISFDFKAPLLLALAASHAPASTCHLVQRHLSHAATLADARPLCRELSAISPRRTEFPAMGVPRFANQSGSA